MKLDKDDSNISLEGSPNDYGGAKCIYDDAWEGRREPRRSLHDCIKEDMQMIEVSGEDARIKCRSMLWIHTCDPT